MIPDLTPRCAIATSRSKTVSPLRLGLKSGTPQELIPLEPGSANRNAGTTCDIAFLTTTLGVVLVDMTS